MINHVWMFVGARPSRAPHTWWLGEQTTNRQEGTCLYQLSKKNQAGVIPRMELYRNVFVRFQSAWIKWNFSCILKKWCMLRSYSRWRGWNWTQFLILHQGNRLAAPITQKKKKLHEKCTRHESTRVQLPFAFSSSNEKREKFRRDSERAC